MYQFESEDWRLMGQDIYGEEGELAGACVGLSGNGTVVAVGSPEYSGHFAFGGRVQIFAFDGTQWNQTAEITGNAGTGAGFGNSCSLSRNASRIVIGAGGATVNETTKAGLVQIFDWSSDGIGSSWLQIGQDLVGDQAQDQFGFAVALSKDGTTVAVGANSNDANGVSSGQVTVYRLR